MKARLTRLTILAALLLPLSLHAQIRFERTYGGDNADWGCSVQQTADHGYVIAGLTNSFGPGTEVYLIRTDSAGDTLWTRTYGGAHADLGNSVRQTADGGCILTGGTMSFGGGGEDVYLIKTDAHGDTMWTRAFGGTEDDNGWSVGQTTDSGFIIAGSTRSFGSGGLDVWLLKTDTHGDTLWTRTFGGTDDDGGYSAQQTTDSGYIIAGATYSFGAGEADVYVIRTDANGDTLWTRTYGGTGDDGSYSVQQTTDGGYIIAGATYSFGAGEADVYVIRTDANGDTLWTRIVGGAVLDEGASVRETRDSGFLVAGRTRSFGAGWSDAYLIRTDASGSAMWTRTFGGAGEDEAWSVQQTSDGGYVIAGYTSSFGAGNNDVYLIKTDSLGSVAVAEPKTSPTRASSLSLSCEPNPSSGTMRISLTPQASNSKPLTLRMYDSQGRMVLSREVSTSSFPLSTSDLPAGAYFIRCEAAGEHATTRIVLQR